MSEPAHHAVDAQAADHVVPVVRLLPGTVLPGYAHPGDAGADLPVAVDCVLAPGERQLVSTGLCVALPEGCVGFVVPRSGLAARHGLTIVNAPGTIDAGYRGELKVCLLNTDAREPVVLHRGDLVAQLVVLPVVRVRYEPAEALPPTERGAAGHGSSGGVAEWRAPVTPRHNGGVPPQEGSRDLQS